MIDVADAGTVVAADDHLRRRCGWLLASLGICASSWWVLTWSQVHADIDNHIAAHGPLPSSAMDRAALSSQGTTAEQALSSDLSHIAGLYPWGPLPLVLAAIAALAGWLLWGSLRPLRTIIGLAASALLVTIPLILFGESMIVALDILE